MRFNSNSEECSTSRAALPLWLCNLHSSLLREVLRSPRVFFDESQSYFGSGEASWRVMPLRPTRSLQQELYLTYPTGCRTRGQPRTFQGFQCLSAGWRTGGTPPGGAGKGDMWPALKTCRHSDSPKRSMKKWPTDQMLSALLMKGK